jgi:hypothetical protein
VTPPCADGSPQSSIIVARRCASLNFTVTLNQALNPAHPFTVVAYLQREGSLTGTTTASAHARRSRSRAHRTMHGGARRVRVRASGREWRLGVVITAVGIGVAC